jgi:UDP-GlcNAc:undecaprenyl-phosphate GlcNAc-1-phosphate transferase
MMEFLNDTVVIDNLTHIVAAGFVSFVITFLLVPWIGKLAYGIKAVDLPPSQRSKSDKSFASRINEGIKPRLGGLAMLIAIIITIIMANPTFNLNSDTLITASGILLGLLILGFVGFMDDKFEFPGIYQLFGQILAASVLIYFGIGIPSTISLFGQSINLETYSSLVSFGSLEFLFIFPAHLITIIWVVMIINFINWVGGVDGLNLSVSTVIAFTMLLFALSSSNIPLAILISIHIGANLGLLPYNYYPSHIIPGSIGDYVNGYMLAVFALLGDARWSSTIIILALPIIDALLVILMRVRKHPEVLKNPLKILSISDTNHLHHRLMAAGYSRKAVLLTEIAIVAVICSIAVTFGINADPDDTSDKLLIASAIAMAFIITVFTVVYVLKERANNKHRISERILREQQSKEAVVNIIREGDEKKDDDEDYERFAY